MATYRDAGQWGAGLQSLGDTALKFSQFAQGIQQRKQKAAQTAAFNKLIQGSNLLPEGVDIGQLGTQGAMDYAKIRSLIRPKQRTLKPSIPPNIQVKARRLELLSKKKEWERSPTENQEINAIRKELQGKGYLPPKSLYETSEEEFGF